MTKRPEPRHCDLAIVGAGFCGTVLLATVLRKTTRRLRICVFDPSPQPWVGPAYATRQPGHLLNVPAGRMSAWPDQPEHFVDWLGSPSGLAARRALGLTADLGAQDFAPRALYGDYLRAIAAEALVRGEAGGHQVQRHAVEIRDCTVGPAGGGVLLQGTGGPWQAAAAAVCIGNPATDLRPGHVSPWQLDAQLLASRRPSGLQLLGSGLTAVDVVVAALDAGFQGPIALRSRRGLLPHVHLSRPHAGSWQAEAWLDALRPPLTRMLPALRRGIEAAAAEGVPWQAAMDALRPRTQALWSALSVDDRRRVLGRGLTYWNVHRHRMAPAVAARLDAARASGQVSLGSGPAVANGEVLRIQCTGPDYRAKPPLLRALVRQGLACWHPTGAGVVDFDGRGRLTGSRDLPLYGVGAMFVGQRLETTAVPELRVQVAAAAQALLQGLEHAGDAFVRIPGQQS